MKLIKFGGRSLANGQGILQVLAHLERTIREKKKLAIVLSARGTTTDQLLELLHLARSGTDFKPTFADFKAYQKDPLPSIDFDEEFQQIENILNGVALTQDFSPRIQDLILAQGELLSVKLLSKLLALRGLKTAAIDSRNLLKTDSNFGNATIDWVKSEKSTRDYFQAFDYNSIPLITGFIASSEQGETTTLGRNGSNYSASLLANFLNARTIISYTHVDGILTADPEMVKNVRTLRQIHYNEASELAGFGASILHSKAIEPLIEKKISLQIVNTFKPRDAGTLINHKKNKGGIKSISVEQGVSLINLRGRGLLGKTGVDARIFGSLSKRDINIGIISQGSSERDVSFVVAQSDAAPALSALEREFQHELATRDIQSIRVIASIVMVTVVGQKIQDFSTALDALRRNNIEILLINNTISGPNIGLILKKKDVKKAVNIIHSRIFGATKKVNIAIIGKGTVGGSLIDQILKAKDKIFETKQLQLNIFAIAGSDRVLLDARGISKNWKAQFGKLKSTENITQAILDFARKHQLENLMAIDNTSSEEVVKVYKTYVKQGFNLISSNKISNTQSYQDYKSLRETLKKHVKEYLYETNVGAGLPIIDTIRLLHDSGENITQIRGVFSGSLSYLFNAYSQAQEPFSYFLKQAIENGYTEPDPREDLSGKDVARKLLILARELDMANELDEVQVENLIPEEWRSVPSQVFLENLEDLNDYFAGIKGDLANDEVLRYIADLSGDLQQAKADLSVRLEKVKTDTAIGNLRGSDAIFQIYTESYGDHPITIMGAGAGAEVTARGVFGDLLRIAYKE